MSQSKRFAVLAVVAILGVLSPAHAADLLVSSALNDQVLRYHGTTGAPDSAFVPAGANGLSAPAGLAFSRDGDFYVAGGGTNAVLRYDGVTGASIDAFAMAGMHGPAGIAVGRDGHLYVSSQLDDSVLRYHGTTGAFIGAFVGAGSGGLDEPTGLAFGPDGHLYVSSFRSDQVLRYHGITGDLIGTFASSATLVGPQGLAFGADGHLYVASFATHRVLRYHGTTGALISTFVPEGSGGLNGPIGLAFGPDGHLYVASFNTNQVLRYNKATGAFINSFLANGSGGLAGPTFLLWNPVKVVHPTLGEGDYTTIQAAVNALPAAGPRIIKIRTGTYREAVTISKKNASALLESQRVVLMAHPDDLPGSVVVTPPKDRNAFAIEQSRFITLKGLTLTGATREAIYVRGGGSGSRDVTIESNHLHHNGNTQANGSTQANGGIYLGRENPRTWVFNNLIRANGRNGVVVECGLQNAPKYFVNNTVVQNGFNGFFLGDAIADEIFLVNNLIVDNGTAAGTTGGRFGLLRESTAPGTGPGTRGLAILRGNMFYRNRAGDIGNVIQTLDEGDYGNLTTLGNEAASCFGSATGCDGAVAGCTFADCGVAVHPLGEIFDLVNFRLAAGSPAIGAGVDSLFHGGAERVPAADFEGDPRPEGLPAIGFDESP